MVYLVLAIVCSSLMMVLFKYIAKFNFPVIYPIIINYIIAFAFGLIVTPPNWQFLQNDYQDLIPAAVFLGALFIIMFYFIGLSSQKAGLSVTSVASRMSVIIPMSFAIFFYDESFSMVKLLGIILAVPAVVITSIKNTKTDWTYIYLPAIIFFGSGLVDTTVEFSQNSLLTPQTQSSFTIIVFSVAGVFGVLLSVFRKYKLVKFFQKKVLLSGIILGLLNYGSLYFIISALQTNIIDDSILFGMNNIGVVVISVLTGMLFFNEKLSKLNYLGIFMSVIAILLLSMHT